MASSQSLAPNDWFDHPELLPPRPLSHTETKYKRRFAVDLHGARGHDQYVFVAPNGVAVIGLAPSHPLVAAHRRATGYQPTQLRYVPPQLEHIKAEELVSAVPDEEGQQDAEAGAPPPSGRAGEAPAVAEAHEERDAGGRGAADGGGAAGGAAAAAAGGDASASGAQAAEGASSNGDGASVPSATAAAAAAPGAAAAGGGGEAASGRPERLPVPECEPFPPEQCARVNFEAGSGRSLAGTKASGKKRGRGAQQLRGGSVVAAVERRGGGASFPIWAVLKGQLLEVNERLSETPGLLYDRPCREGYVAILSPSPEALQYIETRLLSEADYLRLRGLTVEDLL